MYRLTYTEAEQPQTFTFTTGVVLKDFGISRQHAKIYVSEDGVRILDLKSKNGTQVNGVPVVEAPLKDGDRILLAKFQLTFHKTLEGQVVLDERKPLYEESGTIIRSVGELSRMLAAPPPPEVRGPAEAPKAPDLQEIEKVNRILSILKDVGQKVMGLGAVETVVQQVMDIIFEHVTADRGFLMLSEEGTGRLVPMVIKHRVPPSGAEQAQITISKTIADKVTKDRVAILTSDALVDPRFESGQSIHFHGIRSAMCAPLWNNEEVIGIIHLDSNMRTNIFKQGDLDLLSALANYAAVAIERSRLNQKIAAEERKRERLGRFLSPQVARRVLATSESQGGAFEVPETRDVSILFADIVGFTRMSEKMSPTAVAYLLNDYLSRMTDVIFRHEGTLDKYIGDAIMAVFGAPLDMPDHAARAVRAGLEMLERLEEFNGERSEGPRLGIRIGINSGRVVAGEIGSLNKKEYTVLGDTVNTASRLESSVATPMTVVIGPQTYEAVKAEFACRSLGERTLKGKEQVVTAYEVLRPPAPTPAGPALGSEN
jgi:adenylate cyclase